MSITEEQFKTYERIRVRGEFNMFMIKSVKKMAEEEYHVNLSLDDIREIMNNYSDLKEKFRKERNKRVEELNHGPL